MNNWAVAALVILISYFTLQFLWKIRKQTDSDVYVINLPKRTDRLDQFRRHLNSSELSFNNLILIEAIDGSNIKNIENVMPDSTRKIIETGKRDSHAEMTPGMVGCYLSHYKTYEEFLKSGKEVAFIFEDDSKILPKFGNTLEDLPSDWDIVMFGVQACMNCPEVNSRFVKLHDFYGAGGYIINRSGAMKMIQNKENPVKTQVDIYMGNLCKEGKLNVYSVKDNLIETAPLGSDVQMHIG